MKRYLVSVQPVLPGGDTQVLEEFFKPTTVANPKPIRPKK